MGHGAASRVCGALSLLLLLGAVSAQAVRIGGSSSLYPASSIFAAEVEGERPGGSIEVSFAGTAGGFEILCRGAAEVIGASRLATPEEREACLANDVEYVAFPVALDAVMPVVSSENDWARCLTLEEVRRLWSAGPARADHWSDLRQEWPDNEIEFFAPGVASGTYDYWNEQVLGAEVPMRADFFPSEDDRLLAQLAGADPDSISFLGRAQLLSTGNGLRAVALDDGFGCIDPPSLEGQPHGRWPFIRPLFLYVSAAASSPSSETRSLISSVVEAFLSQVGQARLREAGYLPLDEQVRREALARFRARVPGPLAGDYGGQSILRSLPGGWTRRQVDLRGRLLALEGQVQTVGVVHGRVDTLFQRLLDSRGGRVDDSLQ